MSFRIKVHLIKETIFVLFLASVSLAKAQQGAVGIKPSLILKVDGSLEDEAWGNAAIASQFVQVEPTQESKPSLTRALVLLITKGFFA